ncbi:tryptophan-rich sensory protein [Siculibacillus lacustris]|uniref:Tryptophan-rich sensory protein n=1 Tax=Siculibacillus lacustris TaxID=1549641 RepID=A0A4Q9VVT0_9HYPH|nr:TspO/MBR family protein [Siculibacillus lacustris]TBW40369.1 tryptophan-rich sensory protein [Siculibacillus lacustris]
MTPIRFRPGPLVAVGLAVLPVAIAGALGNVVTLPALVPWYAGLAKPWFVPPNGLFAPAWTFLYLTMIVAFWRILRSDADAPGRGAAIRWFLVQISLNALWSIAFFGLHSPPAGLVVLALLLPAIVMTIVGFARVDRPAGLLLVPYLAWTCFATALNLGVWWLNR